MVPVVIALGAGNNGTSSLCDTTGRRRLIDTDAISMPEWAHEHYGFRVLQAIETNYDTDLFSVPYWIASAP